MHRSQKPNRPPAANRAIAGFAFLPASLLALAACSGGGGSAPPVTPGPSPTTALVFGTGTWGSNRWSDTAPVRLDPASPTSSSSASRTDPNPDLIQETSR